MSPSPPARPSPPAPLPDSICALLPDGRSWPCALRLSARARKTRLKVDARGQAELVLPAALGGSPAALARAQETLQSFSPWLQKTLTRLLGDAEQPLAPVPRMLELPASVSLPLTGTVWQVYVRCEPARAGVRLLCEDFGPGQGRLILRGDSGDPDFVPLCCRLLQKWLRQQAQLCLPPRLRWWAERMQVQVGAVRVRSQRTRWGSCSSRGDISLNAVLALLPVPLADHVLLHELCHRRHMNHSARYRAYLQGYAPHWALHEKALNRAWKELPAWAAAF